MTLELIKTFYAYDRWADEHIFAAVRKLNEAQLNEPGTAGHGSIRQTMLHKISAQRNWFAWWSGEISQQEAMSNPIDPASYPDLPAVHAFWDEVLTHAGAFVERLTDVDVAREYTVTFPWNGQTARFTLGEMLLHVANHGTQHRSEVAAMLTAFDCSPGYLDIIFFLTEKQAALPH